MAKQRSTKRNGSKRAHEKDLTSPSCVQTCGLTEWKGRTKAGLTWNVRRGDVSEVLSTFPADHFNCVVTSPPYYWQRDYDTAGQIGLESTIDEYVDRIASAFDAVHRVLRRDGLLFLNLGDTYYSAKGQPKGRDRKNRARRFGLRAVDASGLGVPRKTAIGIPWRVAVEMISRKWTLRSPIIWYREKAIPEPTAKDRPWRKYETVFMFSKSPRYYFSRDALAGDEDIWFIPNRAKSNNGLHAAAFPDQLVQRCIQIGCPHDGIVLDPFAGSGTTLRVALQSQRRCVGIDINPNYCQYIARVLDATTSGLT